MKFGLITPTNRDLVNCWIRRKWYSTQMILRGQIIDMTRVDGVVAEENGEIIGLITYVFYGDCCEIVSFDSLRENQGIGTALLNRVIRIAREKRCSRIVLITTNDNIRAIRYCQRRGFDMIHFYRNAMDISRQMKPEIPLMGENDIPLRHEIEFEMLL